MNINQIERSDLQTAHDRLSAELEDPNGSNEDLRDAAVCMCDVLNRLEMSEAAPITHTPGPWYLSPVSPDLIGTLEPPKLVAQVFGPAREANAHLVSAAPELLDACLMAVGLMAVEEFIGRIPNATTELCSHKLYQTLKSAIAKAKGPQ